MENPLIHIKMLGEFSITIGNNKISDQMGNLKKPWKLLEYLVTFRSKDISQNELIDLFWPEDESNNPVGALKTLLHRVRKLLDQLNSVPSDSIIIQRRGTYGWNKELNCIIDIDEFDNLCKKIIHSHDTSETLELCKQAIDLYKGDFLPKTSLEPWAIPINAYYHSQYVKIVYKAIHVCSKYEMYEEITGLCWKSLLIDAYEEEFHLQLIKSLSSQGLYQKALEHYHYTNNLFLQRFGVTPSNKFKALYKELIKSKNRPIDDMTLIKTQLEEMISENGAYLCEYELFKDITQVCLRASSRNNISIHICLMALTNQKGQVLEQNLLNKVMEKLRICIKNSLRSSDIFSRYSVSQFIIMIPNTSYDETRKIAKRIQNVYSHTTPIYMDTLLQYDIKNLDATTFHKALDSSKLAP